MPLSEQEQRLLDEMERHLLRNDADVVSAPDGARSLSYRNIVYGTILVLVGLGALVVGVSTQLIWVGVVGFVLMLGGVILAVTPMRGALPRDRAPGRRARLDAEPSVHLLHGSHERPLGSPPGRRPLDLRASMNAPTFGSVRFFVRRRNLLHSVSPPSIRGSVGSATRSTAARCHRRVEQSGVKWGQPRGGPERGGDGRCCWELIPPSSTTKVASSFPRSSARTSAGGIVVTRGQERCLYVFSSTEFEAVHERIRQAPLSNKQARDFLRMFLSGASAEMPDSQNRITIPAPLRAYAGLEKDLVVTGVGAHAEIWNADALERLPGGQRGELQRDGAGGDSGSLLGPRS